MTDASTGNPMAKTSVGKMKNVATRGIVAKDDAELAVNQDAATQDVAARFSVALSRIQARVKHESGKTYSGLTPSQVAMLERLRESDGMSVTELAQAEHVSQQAITQRLALLRPSGYVDVHKDPADARRKNVVITDEGKRTLAQISYVERTWLASVVSKLADEEDLAVLARAAMLMENLASSDFE